jgi:hypothetical protein
MPAYYCNNLPEESIPQASIDFAIQVHDAVIAALAHPNFVELRANGDVKLVLPNSEELLRYLELRRVVNAEGLISAAKSTPRLAKKLVEEFRTCSKNYDRNRRYIQKGLIGRWWADLWRGLS